MLESAMSNCSLKNRILSTKFTLIFFLFVPFPVVTWSGFAGSIPAGFHVILSVLVVVCCQLEASASCYSLFQKSST